MPFISLNPGIGLNRRESRAGQSAGDAAGAERGAAQRTVLRPNEAYYRKDSLRELGLDSPLPRSGSCASPADCLGSALGGSVQYWVQVI